MQREYLYLLCQLRLYPGGDHSESLHLCSRANVDYPLLKGETLFKHWRPANDNQGWALPTKTKWVRGRGDDAISSCRINNIKITPKMQQLIVLYTYGLRARTLVFTWSNRCAQKSTNIQIQFNSIVILIFRIVKQSTQMLRLHQHRIQISIRQP